MRIPVFLPAILLMVSPGSAQNTSIPWYSFSEGFGAPSSVSTMTISSVGQPFVGMLQDAVSRVLSGFLADTLFHEAILAVRQQPSAPLSFSLEQNYPNPFNPSTTIRYTVPVHTHVTLTVVDLLGREVATLVNEDREAGQYAAVFDTHTSRTGALASGVYFSVMRAQGFQRVRRMIVLR